MKGRKQMKAPNKIYIDESRITELGGLADAIVPDNRIETSDVCYIRKDALLEWADNWKKLGVSEDFLYAMETLVQHLNSM